MPNVRNHVAQSAAAMNSGCSSQSDCGGVRTIEETTKKTKKSTAELFADNRRSTPVIIIISYNSTVVSLLFSEVGSLSAKTHTKKGGLVLRDGRDSAFDKPCTKNGNKKEGCGSKKVKTVHPQKAQRDTPAIIMACTGYTMKIINRQTWG